MTWRRLAGAAALGLLTTGCGDGAEQQNRPATKIANPYHDELSRLPTDLQRLGVMRAIRDNRNRCRRVETTRYQQDYRQMAMWVALCSEGTHWAVFIAVNGDTQVRDCNQARQLGLPQCRPITTPSGTN
ncbi:MAG: hypothetical protein ACT4OE_03490 [Sphingosinicella sp.]